MSAYPIPNGGALNGTHVPLPGPRAFQSRPHRTGLDWASHTVSGPDPHAIARLARQGLLVVTEETVDEQPVKVVSKPKPSRPRTYGAGWAKPSFDVEEAARLYATGLSIRAVGRHFGVAGQTMRAQLLKAGFETRGPGGGKPRIDVDKAIRLAKAGQPLAEIARAVGASPSAVRTHLRRAEITLVDARKSPTHNNNFRPDLDNDALVREYLAGATIPELATSHDCGTRTIRLRLLAAGVTLRDDRRGHSGGHNKPDAITPAEIAEAIRLYQSGLTARQVGAALGRSESGIHRVLVDAEVTMRKSGDYGHPGRDQAQHLRALMAQHGVTAAQVRAWADATGRDCPRGGPPPQRLVEAYLTAQGNESHCETRRFTA